MAIMSCSGKFSEIYMATAVSYLILTTLMNVDVSLINDWYRFS